MHAAPSVSYPVGRSAFAGRLWAALALLGLAAAIAWSLAATTTGWRQLLALVLVAACAGLAWRGWLRSPVGMLRWDGLAWQWQECASTTDCGRVELALDLQSRMLLHWRGEDSGARWLWIERESASSHWDALRRAVYSRASKPVPTDGKPPAAEQ
jgi:toxin CptA